MADDLTFTTTVATAPSGTVVATDQLGTGQHVQFVKLMDGTLDGTGKIGGDAINGLDVDVTRVSGNVTVVQGTATNLKVDASGVAVPVTDNAGSLTVDGTVGISGTVTVDSELTTADLDTGAGTDTRAVVGIAGAASGGAVLVQATSGGALKADITTIAGTAPTTVGKIDVKGADGDVFVRQATASNLNAQVAGDVAHDGVDSGNPAKIGAKATTSLSGLTLVANADRTHLFAGVDGVLVVRKHTNLEDVVQDRATNTDGASTAFAGGLAAPGAGIRLWVTKITIANSSATFGTVDIRDGSAGSVLWTIPAPATGGCVEYFDPPLKFTANTAVAYDASAAITTITISANGFKSKV